MSASAQNKSQSRAIPLSAATLNRKQNVRIRMSRMVQKPEKMDMVIRDGACLKKPCFRVSGGGAFYVYAPLSRLSSVFPNQRQEKQANTNETSTGKKHINQGCQSEAQYKPQQYL